MWFDQLDHWQTFAAGVLTVGAAFIAGVFALGAAFIAARAAVSRSAGKLKLCARRWRWRYGVSSTSCFRRMRFSSAFLGQTNLSWRTM